METNKVVLKRWDNIQDKVAIIQEARNKYGCFKVAQKFEKPIIYQGREIEWSKHIDVLDLWSTEEWWRVERANNRQIFQSEIVLDVDPEEGETIIQISERTKKIVDSLHANGFDFTAYFSGSRGHHIHLIIPQLVLHNSATRRRIRERFLKKYNCDLQKASDNTMIAMEHCPHWKTGNKKVVVKYEFAK